MVEVSVFWGCVVCWSALHSVLIVVLFLTVFFFGTVLVAQQRQIELWMGGLVSG